MGRTTTLNQPSTCQDRSRVSSNPSSTRTNLEHVHQHLVFQHRHVRPLMLNSPLQLHNHWGIHFWAIFHPGTIKGAWTGGQGVMPHPWRFFFSFLTARKMTLDRVSQLSCSLKSPWCSNIRPARCYGEKERGILWEMMLRFLSPSILHFLSLSI